VTTDLATSRRRAALANLIEAHVNDIPKQRLSAAGTALAVGATYDQVRAAMGGMTLDAAFMRYVQAIR
jgi:hypothetical protein